MLIEGNKIVKVGPSARIAVPPQAQVIDARGMTIMPGLINSNEHIQLNPLYPAPAADLPVAELLERWEANFGRMRQKAYFYLMQGVTSQRQTSGPWKRLLPIKKEIDAGQIPGPRLFLGGALIMSEQFFKHYTEQKQDSRAGHGMVAQRFCLLDREGSEGSGCHGGCRLRLLEVASER